MAFSPALGYPSTVWACMKGGMQAVNGLTAPASNTTAILGAAADTFTHGRDSLAAWQAGTALAAEYENLSTVLALPIAIDTASLAIVTARVAAVRSASLALTALLPVPSLLSASLIASGRPSMGDPGLIEWMMTANIEAYPSGTVVANFALQAAAEAAAWNTLVAALQTQSVNYTGAAFDSCVRMAAASQLVANDIAEISISAAASLHTAWNTIVALPAIFRVANAVACDPTSVSGQQVAIMRYVLNSALIGVNTAIVNLGTAPPTTVSVTTVRQNETLLDIAARAMGDYTRWRDIATVNGLQPPYVATIRPTDGTSVVIPGDQIFLPIGTTITVSTQPVNYNTGFLGTDLYLGPLNQGMPVWTGDFQTQSGYDNLSTALGRRLQTPLGNLIYHSGYGSRIPPQVGAIQTPSTANLLKAFATSAILSDPRVARVASVSVNIGANYAVNVSATAIPQGLQQGVTVNEVLSSQQ